ncbi:von Willebrand factor, type A [Candidatus Sulfopaludibacter sp. SbA3]|nr:von Willebrand factor, type A [Candidatus Sulfopaludibacter sp. SbA3]
MLRGKAEQTLPFALLAVLGFWVLGAGAQVSIQPRQTALAAKRSVPSTMRVDTSLVLIPVGVTDLLNRPVTGLDRSNFRVFDSNVEQQVLSLTFDDAPIAVGLVFDTSGSMDGKMAKSRAAVGEFLRTANPEDEFFLVEFNDKVHLTQPLTADPSEIQARLGNAAPHGRTALLDAIGLSLGELKKSSKPRKALVIFSDGGDNRSRLTEKEVRGMVREGDALIYAMGIFEMNGTSLRAEEAAGPSLLHEITEASGGRLFPVGDVNDLPDMANRIGVELHNQYVLGYAPSNLLPDGKRHKVRVKVIPPRRLSSLHVDWRLGYRAPAQ